MGLTPLAAVLDCCVLSIVLQNNCYVFMFLFLCCTFHLVLPYYLLKFVRELPLASIFIVGNFINGMLFLLMISYLFLAIFLLFFA